LARFPSADDAIRNLARARLTNRNDRYINLELASNHFQSGGQGEGVMRATQVPIGRFSERCRSFRAKCGAADGCASRDVAVAGVA